MYTKFIRSFNSFFGKKGNYIFSGFLVILSILLIGCSIYAFFNLNIRDKRFVERYVYFRDEKAYYVDNDGELEVTFLSYNDGSALNPRDYDGSILKMYCSKTDRRNCYYVKNNYNYNYALFGLSFGIVLFALGLIFRKLYKTRNTNYGSIKVFRPIFITLFLFGAYIFTLQVYYMIDYMRFNIKSDVVSADIIGEYKNNYLVSYVVSDNHYSTLVSKNRVKDNVINVKYSLNNPSVSYDRSNFNLLFLIIGIFISCISISIIIMEKDIDKKIKVIEKKSKKESYRRKK